MFALTMVFLLWKCSIGFAHKDEAFYLTIPYRMCMGDSLLLQEWHPSQLFAFMVYPAMKLFLLITQGDMTGVLYTFRILFTVCWGMAAYFYYFRLKRLSLTGAMLASLSFLVFTPFGIMALSYNTLGVLMLVNAGVLIATNEKRKPLTDVLAGLSFAGAVLCCPYLVLAYAAFTTATLVLLLRKNRSLLRCWLFFTLGCAILLLIFCVMLLANGSPKAYLQTLPEVLNDPQHPKLNIAAKAEAYVRDLFLCNEAFLPCFLVSVAAYVLLRRKDRLLGGAIVFLMSQIITVVFLLKQKPSDVYINYIMLPINLAGLYCALCMLREEPGLKPLFWGLWVPGALYTWCIHLSSNNHYAAVSSAAAVMTVASIVLIVRFLQLELPDTEIPAGWLIIAAGVILLFAVEFYAIRLGSILLSVLGALAMIGLVLYHGQLGIKELRSRGLALFFAVMLLAVQFYGQYSLRASFSFWEGDQSQLTSRIEEGHEKGLVTLPSRNGFYQTLLQETRTIRDDPQIRKLLVLSGNFLHIYLGAQKEIAAFSAWLSGVNSLSLRRLDTYFALFPDKQPDAIYIEAAMTSAVDYYAQRGYKEEENALPSGAHLMRRIPAAQ